MSTYLAADFGGGSGRIMAGTLTEGKLKLEEVYRFANRQIKLGNCVYWDFLSLFEEMKNGLRVAATRSVIVIPVRMVYLKECLNRLIRLFITLKPGFR